MTVTGNPRIAPRAVVIVGDGPVGLLAAITFAAALPQATVTVIATPDDPAALADRLPVASPRALAFLATLGIDEPTLVAAGATHRIGERFAWGDAAFTLGTGEGVPIVAGAALHQLWLAHGAAGRFEELVPAATLAATDRFVLPEPDPRSLLSRVDHGLRIDPVRGRAMLTARARAARVTIMPSAGLQVERDGDVVRAVTLADGTRIAADLFIDASGPAALLAADDGWIDWSAALPVDRLLLATAVGVPSPTDVYAAVPAGWTATWPLADCTLTAFAYAGDITDDAEARHLFVTPADTIALHPGRRVRPLVGNVLALGDAAAMLGPLGMPGFALACAHLSLALDLMPARDPDPFLIAEYNRRATLQADRLCDHAAAFYHVAVPPGTFWGTARTRAVPEGLAVLLAQFRQRGTLPPLEEEMVSRADWAQALLGLGVRPVRADPIALSVPPATATDALTRLRDAIATLPGRLPPYPDYLGMLMRGRA
ncbi:tryptophan 7-halogenase [Sphingomonas cynarae]|uniref:Tryptophan 7-halogenase n=1 Tax=Sphingomonas cynarae TaxID=930197 RepID=A0ABP7DF20_9SPHN